MSSAGRQTASGPQAQILQYLQRHGYAGVRELAALLGVTATAVREQLAQLQQNGMLDVSSERQGPGRPRLIYRLSHKAQQGFPKLYDLLAGGLLHELIADESPERVAQLLDRVSRRLAAEYAGRIEATGIAARLNELRSLLEQRGVPAGVVADGSVLELYACPFYDVAAHHPEICLMERRMIEYVVGRPLDVSTGIRDGSHTCRFIVRTDGLSLTAGTAAPSDQ
jgi:DeoR family transcriptional regulator, suf operon transcriptional repressor